MMRAAKLWLSAGSADDYPAGKQPTEHTSRPPGSVNTFLKRHSMLLAALAAFALRLFFVLRFPAGADDTRLYEELADNWVHRGVYGVLVDGRLTPVMIRLPGYPAFLAVIHALFGNSARAVMLVQAAIDVSTCFLVAALAARCVRLAGRSAGLPARTQETGVLNPQLAFTAALWLAALCPFTANYSAVLLTEVLATFLCTLALVLLVDAFTRAAVNPTDSRPALRDSHLWLLGGFVAGLGTLVRPETPLLLAGAALALVIYWRRPAAWPRLLRAGALIAAGLLLPLLPWAARNWHTFGTVQFLAPRYAEMPGEFVPTGFYQWTRTWLVRFPDVQSTLWKADSEPMSVDDLPSSAFDNPQEQARIAALFEEYNKNTTIDASIDARFAEIAAERTARHPLRTYVWVPLGRAATLWFQPRIELLPYSGKVFPIATEWDEDRTDLLVTLAFAALGFLYAALGIFGLWRARYSPAAWLGVAYLLVRTAFLTHIETPEPRYVLPSYPVLLALAAVGASAFVLHKVRKRQQPVAEAV